MVRIVIVAAATEPVHEKALDLAPEKYIIPGKLHVIFEFLP